MHPAAPRWHQVTIADNQLIPGNDEPCRERDADDREHDHHTASR